ncbi:MAG: pyridoxamine 5'-phosphate oxidase family protein [Actinomycetota bacterium]
MRLDELPASADAFLRGLRLATIVQPHEPFPNAVPVWFTWTGDAIEFFTQPNRPKVGRLRRDPRVSVLISAEAAEPVYWVRIDGHAELHDDATDLVAELTERYLAVQPGDVSDMRERLLTAAPDAVRVRVVPEQLWHFGG